MKAETYTALLKDLQKLQKALVASQIAAVRRDAAQSARMERLHAEAEVGGRVDDFVATVARKSTVLFLLRTVFVRVLEDLGILGVKRIRDEWGFAAFREVAPALGLRAYFRFVFRDLAVDFPALFACGDDELPLPDEDGCRALWNLWHHPNKEGERYVWDADGLGGAAFDSRFLGDLYQDLDADIRKRYALLQTPRFVESYILNHTLTPALVEFDPGKLRAEGKTFRLLDPTCGSGHFVIGGFHRLADWWRDRDGLSEWDATVRALESVWGADLNEHAVEIAAFRLLLEVVARTGVRDLERLAKLKLNLRSMDSLIPWERTVQQAELFPAKDRLDAYATPKQRRENAAFLGQAFHVVVGNPPYITPKDVQKRADYAAFYPDSCFMNYALSAPFAERILALGSATSGFSGQITANSFMKRQFGRNLVQRTLPRFDLTLIVDTSGAYIPGHGTPTVILVGRSRQPAGPTIIALQGKRGEPRRPEAPAQGLVWSAIRAASFEPTDNNPFITVAEVPRQTFSTHPWSMGGGQARAVLDLQCAHATHRLAAVPGVDTGLAVISGEDSIYESNEADLRRHRVPMEVRRCMINGDAIRDFGTSDRRWMILPNDLTTGKACPEASLGAVKSYLWRFKQALRSRIVSGSSPMEASGKSWYEVRRLSVAKFRAELTIACPLVSTHNHFVLDRDRSLFHHSATVIKLPPTATLDDHFHLLGLLNSSTLGFWMKQVFHDKGGGGIGGGLASEDWEKFYEFDSTKLQQAPIATHDRAPQVALAQALDALATERAACLPAALLAAGAWSPSSLAPDLTSAQARYLALTHRMVALQEELDWLTYGSFGLIEPAPTVAPEAIEPLAPGHRPFELALARRDDEADDDEKSAWWSRHGHDRVTDLPAHYSEAHRARVQQRLDLIESDPRIALLETPPYKRRWQLADWPTETRKAAESWLLDRLEDLFAPGGALAEPKAYRLEDIVAAWSRDPRVPAVAGVWTGTGLSVDLTLVAEKLLRANALPDNPHRIYSEEGLRKLGEWKRVWALQDQEDAHEKAVADAKARGEPPPKLRLVDPEDPNRGLDAIPLPPKFDKADFAKGDYHSIRKALNVPRERFILFADLSPHRFGWNGWRDRDRALAQVEAFTLAETDPQQPVPAPTSDDPRRCGVTYGLWESLPDVKRWGSADEHGELLALAREACRQPRCPCPLVEAWKAQVLHGAAPDTEPRKGRKKAAEVSLGERAWVSGLFTGAEALDLAAVWTRHLAQLAAPSQLSMPGLGGMRDQLTMPGLSGTPTEITKLDETRLAVVVDDLVASGDLDTTGRGKKRRFVAVRRVGA